MGQESKSGLKCPYKCNEVKGNVIQGTPWGPKNRTFGRNLN